MLKKLRRKFIAIAMLSVSIVLIAIVGTINIANYISTNEALDARLKLIAGNGGTFPDLLEPGSMRDEGNKNDSIDVESNKKMMMKQTPAQKAQTPIQKTQTHSAIQQMKEQIKGLPRSKNHHPAEQMYSHRRI